jgi:uncharacterized protein
MWVVSVALIVVIPGLFLLPYVISHPELSAGSDLAATLATDPVAIALQIIAIMPAHLLTLALAWLVVTRGRIYRFTEMLGWRSGGMQWWHYLGIMLGFFVLAAGVGAMLPEQDNEMLRIIRSSPYAVYLVAFMAVVTAPIVEEVIYRGLLFSSLQKNLGTGAAIAGVTFLFSLVHLPQYYPSVSTMILLTVLSLVLTLIRARTGNLLPCIVLHTVFNAFQAVILIAEPYLKVQPTVETAFVSLY